MNILKKAAIATSLVAGFAATAMAEETTFTACTKDGQTATLVADVSGGVPGGPTLKEVVAKAWTETAKDLSGMGLMKQGYPIFVGKIMNAAGTDVLTDDAALTIIAAPTIGAPSCTP